MAKRAYDYYQEGTVGDDYLYGTNYRDYIQALGGDDTLYGHNGADQLYGDAGADTFYGGSGNDQLYGGDGSDTFIFSGYWGQDTVDEYSYPAESNSLVFQNFYSNEAIYTQSGDSLTIRFSGRTDYVRIDDYGWNSDAYELQFIDGTAGPQPSGVPTNGDDDIAGTSGSDTIDALDGNDLVNGNGGDDTIGGNYGNDTIYGNAGNDRVNGGYGDDFVYGGDGNDNVRGGPGYDRLYGGAGQDDFDFDLVSDSVVGSRRDEIFTFVRGQDDIDITGIATGKSGQAAFKFVDTKAFTAAGQVRETVINGDTVVQGNTDADKAVEFEIGLDGRFNLAASDFAL